eukprot:TRINITY_DN1181_c1_g1_i1.p1 TRINITY_DN1181_c1_g1~~TRINITY_DN1181_c1_g1_i1.p1  ORF type:complete len:731 (-),score=157.12 TRINITY_DN1181_c1_g1_i1:69-2261(-)
MKKKIVPRKKAKHEKISVNMRLKSLPTDFIKTDQSLLSPFEKMMVHEYFFTQPPENENQPRLLSNSQRLPRAKSLQYLATWEYFDDELDGAEFLQKSGSKIKIQKNTRFTESLMTIPTQSAVNLDTASKNEPSNSSFPLITLSTSSLIPLQSNPSFIQSQATITPERLGLVLTEKTYPSSSPSSSSSSNPRLETLAQTGKKKKALSKPDVPQQIELLRAGHFPAIVHRIISWIALSPLRPQFIYGHEQLIYVLIYYPLLTTKQDLFSLLLNINQMALDQNRPDLQNAIGDFIVNWMEIRPDVFALTTAFVHHGADEEPTQTFDSSRTMTPNRISYSSPSITSDTISTISLPFLSSKVQNPIQTGLREFLMSLNPNARQIYEKKFLNRPLGLPPLFDDEILLQFHALPQTDFDIEKIPEIFESNLIISQGIASQSARQPMKRKSRTRSILLSSLAIKHSKSTLTALSAYTEARGVDFLDLNPKELGEYLWNYDLRLFIAVRPEELLLNYWEERFATSHPPSYVLRVRYNKVAYWVITEIVSVVNLKRRVEVVKRFIIIAEKCWKLRNYNSALAIYVALNSSSVFRLKNTWKEVPNKYVKTFHKRLKAFDSNYKVYRSKINFSLTHNLSCVPLFDVLINDLIHAKEISEHTKDNVSNEQKPLLNFKKIQQIGSLIHHVMKLQQIPNQLPPPPVAPSRQATVFHYAILLPNVIFDNNKIFQMSLHCEPRVKEL